MCFLSFERSHVILHLYSAIDYSYDVVMLVLDLYGGQVTFFDPESARRACENPSPVIDGRRANCNLAALGRPRPSGPFGMSLWHCQHIYDGF